jgi:uncharacterized membrane protein
MRRGGDYMKRVSCSIVVDVPVAAVYQQWTQFEEFPRFMEGVESVRQLDDSTLQWVAEIGGRRKEWDAHITEQTPYEVIAWEGFGDSSNLGRVFFEPAGNDLRTTVDLTIDYETDGVVEAVGDAVGFVESRVCEDLERFKEFIESRPSPTGAWSGEVHEPPKGNR